MTTNAVVAETTSRRGPRRRRPVADRRGRPAARAFPDSDIVARLGGDESAHVCQDADRGDADAVADRIQDHARDPFDVDGDRVEDLVVADGSGKVWALLGNGDGTFVPHLTSPVEHQPVSDAAGDFDQDGDIDIVTAARAAAPVTDRRVERPFARVLLAYGSVERFAKQVSVARVPSGLLQEVQKHPP